MPRKLVLGIAVVLVAAVLLGLALRDDDAPSRPGPTGERAPHGLAAFYHQVPRWTSCGTYLCTSIQVPLDYAEPGGRRLELGVRVLPATDGSTDRLLFVNPGGPGGSAVEYVPVLAPLLSPALRRAYAVVGVDPRGVGTSEPVECVDRTTLDAYLDHDPTPDDAAEEKVWTDSSAKLYAACRKQAGDLVDHVSTEESARDLDVARAVLGQRRLTYYGASYGTQLGATYAATFPGRVGRLVLDGGVDVGLARRVQVEEQAAAREQAWASFVRWCAKRADCPLPKGRAAATDLVTTLVASADEKPLASSGRVRKASQAAVLQGLVHALGLKRAWPALVVALNRAQYDDGTAFRQLADAAVVRGADGRYDNNSVVAGIAVRCLDDPQRTSAQQVRSDLAPRLRTISPLLGEDLAWSAALCDGWEATGERQEAVSTETKGRALVLGTTRDPVTPFVWSKRLATDLGGAYLVRREGDGHTAFGLSSCVDAIVAAYLLGDAPKRRSTTCAGAS